jgi:hypothetical protein
MLTRRFVLAVFYALLVTAVAVPAVTHAGGAVPWGNRLTFNSPVALPGHIVLVPGTYMFEAGPLSMHPDIVRVTSADNQKVFYQGFTGRVRRPADVAINESVSLGEARVGAPVPIAVWYPLGSNIGHQFRY